MNQNILAKENSSPAPTNKSTRKHKKKNSKVTFQAELNIIKQAFERLKKLESIRFYFYI